MARNRSITFLAGTALIALVAVIVAGCGGGGGATASTAPPHPMGQAGTVGVADSSLGKILVDSTGHTLYQFAKDSGTHSACSGACATDWPPLRANGKPTAGNGAKASLVSTTKRSDGKPQVTYNGHPVYRFEGDHKPGDTNGQGLTEFGGSWYVLSPAGNVISMQPSNSGGQPSNSGGGGGGY